MRAVLREELGLLDSSPLALRRFGLAVGGVFLAISLVVFWRSGWMPTTPFLLLAVPGAILVVGGLARPTSLRIFHRGWMLLAFILGFLMTRLILTLVFGLMVIPIGLALRLVGKDLLSLRLDRAQSSYWVPKPPGDPLSERLRRLY